MMLLSRLGLSPQSSPCRLLIAVTLAALFGIAAGRTVISVSGSVAVVDGESMAPNYPPGTRVYTAPISAPIERGDVVLVDDGHQELALKRVIGLPGETVQLWRGYIFINRRMLEEPYLPKYTYTFPDQHSDIYAFELTGEEYLVLGDNRARSVDSRAYGPVQRNQIRSRVPRIDGVPQARFLAYTLPSQGGRTIRPLVTSTGSGPVSHF